MSITARQIKANALVVRHAPALARPTVVRLATASLLAGMAVAAAPAAPFPMFTGTGQTSVDGSRNCARAIATYRDIFIDVLSCSTGRASGQAVKLTQAIADNADSQSV